MITAELRRWKRTRRPIIGFPCFEGDVYSDIHGRWPDGSHIHTSPVVKEDENEERILVYTMNSIYLCKKQIAKKKATDITVFKDTLKKVTEDA